MLKFRIIFSSFLFLLLVGMNSNARASVKSTDAVENSADDQESNKESNEQHSGQIITDLDFFGAFSLVNVQLQWRDLTADLSQEDTDSDASFDPNEIFVEASDVNSLSVQKESLPTQVAVVDQCLIIPTSASQQMQSTVRFVEIQSEQRTQLIAFIQNCGTYPKS